MYNFEHRTICNIARFRFKFNHSLFLLTISLNAPCCMCAFAVPFTQISSMCARLFMSFYWSNWWDSSNHCPIASVQSRSVTAQCYYYRYYTACGIGRFELLLINEIIFRHWLRNAVQKSYIVWYEFLTFLCQRKYRFFVSGITTNVLRALIRLKLSSFLWIILYLFVLHLFMWQWKSIAVNEENKIKI